MTETFSSKRLFPSIHYETKAALASCPDPALPHHHWEKLFHNHQKCMASCEVPLSTPGENYIPYVFVLRCDLSLGKHPDPFPLQHVGCVTSPSSESWNFSGDDLFKCLPPRKIRSLSVRDDPVKPGAKVLRKTCRFRLQRIIHLSTFRASLLRWRWGLRMSEDEAYHPHTQGTDIHVWMLNNPSEKSSKSSSLATDRWKLISSKFNFSF